MWKHLVRLGASMRATHTEQRWARTNAIVGAAGAATAGTYAGFWLGFQSSTMMYGMGAAGGGVPNLWQPLGFTLGSGLAGAALGAAGGALTYPAFYAQANVSLVAFPFLRRLEEQLPRDIVPKRLALRTCTLVGAGLLALDVLYLRELGLVLSVPASVLCWERAARKP